MVETARAARVPSVGPEYNSFLYATIGIDANGTALSVLSAMARMNLDPWKEAASLAGMSAKAAAGRLSVLIAALPGRPSDPEECAATAARLVALLPQHSLLESPRHSPLPQQGRLNVPPQLRGIVQAFSSTRAIYVVILLIALTLAFQWFVAKSPAPARQETPASQTAARPNVPLSH